MGLISLLLIGLGISLIVMFAVWLVSVRLNNAGIVDIAWSGLFALLAAVYALLGAGDSIRKWVAAGMVIFWSVRLATHLGRRVLSHLDTEDSRYAELREKWGEAANRKMLGFFLFQGLTNVALSVPVLLVALDDTAGLDPLHYTGLAVWLVAIIGESVADAQLNRFKKESDDPKGVMRSGLWRYSRHPNYFFEWLNWCGIALFALPSPLGWIALYCPLLMFWFLYKVTGIPATERASVRKRGEAYREYQRTTSAFFPWFPKDSSS